MISRLCLIAFACLCFSAAARADDTPPGMPLTVTEAAVFPDCLALHATDDNASSKEMFSALPAVSVTNNCKGGIIIAARKREPLFADPARPALPQVQALMRTPSLGLPEHRNRVETEEQARVILREFERFIGGSHLLITRDGDDCTNPNWKRWQAMDPMCQGLYEPDASVNAGAGPGWSNRMPLAVSGNSFDYTVYGEGGDLLPGGFRGYARGKLTIGERQPTVFNGHNQYAGGWIIDTNPAPAAADPDGKIAAAAKGGDSAAQLAMGDMAAMAAKPDEAEGWWKKAAAQGDALAQYRLGSALRHKDATGAAKWLDLAKKQGIDRSACDPARPETCACVPLAPLQYDALKGDDGAQFMLAHVYLRESCLDLSKAEPWLRKAAEQGNSGAIYWLGRLKSGIVKDGFYPFGNFTWFSQYWVSRMEPALKAMKPDAAETVKWWSQLGKQGSIFAAAVNCTLGMLQYDGADGVEKDTAAAMAAWGLPAAEMETLQQKAAAGDKAAPLGLLRLAAKSSCHSAKPLVDLRQKMIEKAAADGSADGQCLMGDALADTDPAKAAEWFEKAADQGHAPAMNKMGFYYQYNAKEKDTGEAAAWYEKAAKAGYAASACSLMNFYYAGDGVSKDLDKAFYWRMICAKHVPWAIGTDEPVIPWTFTVDDADEIAAEAAKFKAGKSYGCLRDAE